MGACGEELWASKLKNYSSGRCQLTSVPNNAPESSRAQERDMGSARLRSATFHNIGSVKQDNSITNVTHKPSDNERPATTTPYLCLAFSSA
jgi:hypothetical protein